jgi:RNA polymerase sigma-70 factor (ECF subfamily)
MTTETAARRQALATSEGERRQGPRIAPRCFATTRWSLVIQAAEPGGSSALAELCRAYWSPVHAFIQGHGVSSEDAADVTQEFFEMLLSRNDIARVEQARGQFRSWLRTCARNHLYNWFAQKRGLTVGGRAVHVSVDLHADELKDEPTAERLFDRRWALTVLDRALTRLKVRYERANKLELFAHLHVSLGGESDASDKELSLLLGKSAGALKVERHRLKQRFQECLRAEVIETVAEPGDVDAEIRRLIEALA